MKKLVIAFLLIAASASARPAKEICRELGQGCQSVDSPDLVELKLLFNEINRTLVQALHDQQEFNTGTAIERKSDYDAEIARLEAIRDNLVNLAAKAKMQDKIDKLASQRDFLDKNVPNDDGSDPPRLRASKLGPVVSSLNLQLNDVQLEIDAQ